MWMWILLRGSEGNIYPPDLAKQRKIQALMQPRVLGPVVSFVQYFSSTDTHNTIPFFLQQIEQEIDF